MHPNVYSYFIFTLLLISYELLECLFIEEIVLQDWDIFRMNLTEISWVMLVDVIPVLGGIVLDFLIMTCNIEIVFLTCHHSAVKQKLGHHLGWILIIEV